MKTTLRPSGSSLLDHEGWRRVLPSPVVRYAILLFLLTATLIVAVAITLVRNADRSSWQQSRTALAGGAQVGASSFATLRSNLRVQVSQLATSLELQRAVVTGNQLELRRIASARHARIELRAQTIGALPAGPRVVSTARITDGLHVLAKITMALPLGSDVLTLLRQATPLPAQAGLVLVHAGRVVAGAPAGEPAVVRSGRVVFNGNAYAVQGARLEVAHSSVFAVEPAAAIDAMSQSYRRFVMLAAALTLAMAAVLATRLARPIARVVGDVARLTRQAQTDALSGLPNRRSLNDRLEGELARARLDGTSVSFVIADIDDFKAINDGFGHQTGDHIIRAVARVLQRSVRELDMAARFGGEEFALVLPGARLDDACRTAERVRAALGEVEVPTPTGTPARVTASFGVAEFPTYGSVEGLVAAADAALYQAKRSGKNQVATATVQGSGGGGADPAPVPLVSVV
jgi:diguanylate cyclase (GGDEF)-like protein